MPRLASAPSAALQRRARGLDPRLQAARAADVARCLADKFEVIVDAMTVADSAAWRTGNPTTVYDRGAMLRVTLGRGPWPALGLTDLTDALKAGATCTHYRAEIVDATTGAAVRDECVVNLVYAAGSAHVLARQFDALPWGEASRFGDYAPQTTTVVSPAGRAYRVQVRREARPAIREFSPFHLNRFAPLAAAPAKWTVRHAIAAIVNRQYTDLRCHYQQGSDGMGDGRPGPIESPIAFARRLIESPSGWRAYTRPDSDRVSILCHTFDSNSMAFALDPVAALGGEAAPDASAAWTAVAVAA